jgi:hypothetical protein
VRRLAVLVPAATCAALTTLALSACGSSSSPKLPTIQAAHTYHFTGFEPAGPVEPGKPVSVSFTITKPDGTALTDYKRGSGPHTGVHLIIVRSDLSTIIHRHPPIDDGGKATQVVTFPEPGTYRVVVDAYPNVPTSPTGLPTAQSNFQLFETIHVSGTAVTHPLPPFSATQTVDRYRIHIVKLPALHAIQAQTLDVTVTDPNGKRVQFTPWYGALAHAIFFRQGSLDYFHTHVCAPGASGCTSIFGATRVVGSSSTPGELNVGVLLPVPGTWRLFLQCRVNGYVLTAPFTLEVS